MTELTDDDPPTNAPTESSDLDPRMRRTLELVYQVEGVVAAKVWAMPNRMAVGVRIGAGHGPPEVLARIDAVTLPLREPGEQWDFGLLDGDA
jgi:hypothetical protein